MPMVDRTKYQAILFVIGKPSVVDLAGSRGHRVLLSKDAVNCMLEEIIGTPLWTSSEEERWGHTHSIRLGTIHNAWVEGDLFCISGFIEHKFEHLSLAASSETLGVSWEIGDAFVKDLNQKVWEITYFTQCTGVHVLPQHKAGHRENCLFWIV
jgi:hypothetical protein